MSNDNTNATSNKRKRGNDTEDRPISILKRTRNEAKSAKSTRVNWRHKSNENQNQKPSKAQIKMDKRLKPIEETLASLPKPLASQFKSFASSILSRKIEIIHCKKRTHFHESTPTFFPSSARFQFELSCKEEFKDNTEFIELKNKTNTIVEETKKALREAIISVQKIEEEGSKSLLRQEFINGLLDIFEMVSLYTRTATKDVSPPFDDQDSSEMLLQRFFYNHCAENAHFYNYLHIDKKYMLAIIKARQTKIKWTQDEENNPTTEEMDILIDEFFRLATTKCFPIIEEITIELLDDYLKQLNEEEAVQKIEALQKNKATRSVTAEVATIIATEPSLDAAQMKNLIDDRISIAAKAKKNTKKSSTTTTTSTSSSTSTKNQKLQKNSKGTRTNQSDNAVKRNGSNHNNTTNHNTSNNSEVTNTHQHQHNRRDNQYSNTHNYQHPHHNHFYQPTRFGTGRGRGRMGRGGRGAWHRGGRGRGRGR